MPSYAETMDGPDDEGIRKTVEQAVLELQQSQDIPMVNRAMLVKLECGCTYLGATHMQEHKIRVAGNQLPHRALCPNGHGIQLFVDVVLGKELPKQAKLPASVS